MYAPIPQGRCPLPGDPFRGQTDQLQQRHIAGKDALVFGDLTDLAMISLDGIGRINEPANAFRVFKIGG